MCSKCSNPDGPQSLMEAVVHFADVDVAHAYVASLKWPDGVVCCPECGCVDVGTIASRRMYQCKSKECRKQFSVKVGTIFEDSALPLNKWLVAVWCIVNAKNGISSCELARAIGVTQKSAWHMLHRIRLAMQTKTYQQITGEVEADDCRIGGRAHNMHEGRRKRVLSTIANKGKTIVHGLLERGGEVRAKVVPNYGALELMRHIRENVKPGSQLYTDIHSSYRRLKEEYKHAAVDHMIRYVDGKVHCNGLENFWSLLRRALKGTYVQVAPEHLQAYVDEQVRRFNTRKMNDSQRFHTIIKDVVGRKLTYAELIA